ncbi:ANTAR domain-containing protein [Streptomyces sp. NPDC087440]|uniref:ANTAR domain-containing protein n=1 Tax=Streptomyces sp. NPDC087440 TaxID=3365790 RepID=UPI00382F069F
MPESRVARRVRAAAEGDFARLPQRLAAALCGVLGVNGVTLSLATDTPERQLLAASGPVAVRLEELQFESAEGPCVSACAEGVPMLWNDVREETGRWPVFGSRLREELPQIGSVHGFPLGTAPAVGSIDLFAYAPRRLSGRAVARALRASATVLEVLLESSRTHTDVDRLPQWEPEDVLDAHWGTTHRAVGMLMEQWGVDAQEALARLRARAFASGRPLPELAAEVVAGNRDSDAP